MTSPHFKRPSKEETEEDLLRLQDEYLKTEQKSHVLQNASKRSALFPVYQSALPPDCKQQKADSHSAIPKNEDPPLLNDVIERMPRRTPSAPVHTGVGAGKGFPDPPKLSRFAKTRSTPATHVGTHKQSCSFCDGLDSDLRNQVDADLATSVSNGHKVSDSIADPSERSSTTGTVQTIIFDFLGKLVNGGPRVVFHRQGCTLQQMLSLIRSRNVSQRQFGLTTLSHVYYNLHRDTYPPDVQHVIRESLYESKAWLLLRMSLDDAQDSVTFAAIRGYASWLLGMHPNADVPELHCEVKTFQLWGVEHCIPQALATPPKVQVPPTEHHGLFRTNPVKGLICTQFLDRICYLLRSGHLPIDMVIKVLQLVLYIAQQSEESALSVVETDGLLSVIAKVLVTSHREKLEKQDSLLYNYLFNAYLELFRTVIEMGVFPAENVQLLPVYPELLKIASNDNLHLPDILKHSLQAQALALLRALLRTGPAEIESVVSAARCLMDLSFTLPLSDSGEACLETYCFSSLELVRLVHELVLYTKCAQHGNLKLTLCLPHFHQVALRILSLEKISGTMYCFLSAYCDLLVEEFHSVDSNVITDVLSGSLWNTMKKDSGAFGEELPAHQWACWASYVKLVGRVDRTELAVFNDLFQHGVDLITKKEHDIFTRRWILEFVCTFLALSESGKHVDLALYLLSETCVGDEDLAHRLLSQSLFVNQLTNDLCFPKNTADLVPLYDTLLCLNKGTRSAYASTSTRLFPSDWLFSPFLYFFKKQESVGVTTRKDKDVLVTLLRFIESTGRSFSAIKDLFSYENGLRLLYVFLLSDDAQCEVYSLEEVATPLEQLLSLLFCTPAQPQNIPPVDTTNTELPLQVFSHLSHQYKAGSFGNAFLGRYVMMALATFHDPKVRLLVWDELAELLHTFTHNTNDVPVPFGLDVYLFPTETHPHLIHAYATALSSRKVTRESTPFLYFIAVHHCFHLLATPEHTPSIAGLKASLSRVPQVVNDLVHFVTSSSDAPVLPPLCYEGPELDVMKCLFLTL
jgi:hypothetical protein